MRIGIDFDNTIVSYGASFVRAAVELGFLDAGTAAGKTAVRDALRALPDGEEKWRRLQRVVYGPAIDRDAAAVRGRSRVPSPARARPMLSSIS